MNLANRSVVLWLGVMFFTITGLLAGVEIGIRAGGSGFFGGIIGLIFGFFAGVLGARWTLGR